VEKVEEEACQFLVEVPINMNLSHHTMHYAS
jgi:hypothetical protein